MEVRQVLECGGKRSAPPLRSATAEVLGLALRKTERLWAFARAWLRAELGGETRLRNTGGL